MKRIRYEVIGHLDEYTSETESVERQVFVAVDKPYTEVNEEIAKREAHNGEYIIEDDGQPELEPEPVQGTVSWDELAKALQEGVDSI